MEFMILTLNVLWKLSVFQHAFASMSKLDIQVGFASECSMIIIKTIQCNDYNQCVLFCVKNIECASFTYDPDTRDCNLLRNKLKNIRRVQKGNKVYGYFIERAENLCYADHCKNGGKCFYNKNIYSNKCKATLTCRCAVGYIGAICELERTRYWIIGGYSGVHESRIIEMIPETKSVSVLNRELLQPRSGFVAGYKQKVQETTTLARGWWYWRQPVGSIYVHGGINDGVDLVSNIETFPSSDCYNYGYLYWSGQQLSCTSAAITYPSQQHDGGCGGIVENNFYACFGYDNEYNYINYCDVYDIQNNFNHSTISTGLTTKQLGVACMLTKDYNMYVLGGYPTTNAFNRVNLLNGTSVPLTHSPAQSLIHSSSVVWFENHVVACGGLTSVAIDTCYAYIISNDTWIEFPSLVVPRYNHKLRKWREHKILAIGGNGVNGQLLASVEAYEDGNWTVLMWLPYAVRDMEVVDLTRG